MIFNSKERGPAFRQIRTPPRSGSVALARQIGNTAFDMDERNQAEQPQRYVWPRFVLGALVLAIVLAIVWMSVLVHRVRDQRQDTMWPVTNRSVSIWSTPTQSVSTQAAPVVSRPQTNSLGPSQH
jgi:heme/copper-type cytochrome/quinol oxidase subunit 2